MKETLGKIWKVEMGHCSSQMDNILEESLKMIWQMEKEYSKIKRTKYWKEYGKKDIFSGQTNDNLFFYELSSNLSSILFI